MEEYEYSFEVSDLTPYIKYCQENNYEKTEETIQIRTLYKNSDKVIARITIKEKNGTKQTLLDFKDDNNSDEILKVSRETIPLVVNDLNKEAIYSILDILNYKKDKVLNRKRIVYVKDSVVFELDSYSSPHTMFVIGIEGKKENVDKIYLELKAKFISDR